MGISTAIGIGIQFSRGGGQSWESYWVSQPEVLFFGLYSEISGGQMPNKVTGATDYLTVAGVAGSETYQTPNTAPYQTADTDYVWFKTDVSQRITTTAELIGYDFTRTIVKYGNVSPNAIEAIMILKSDVDTAKMRDDFDLSIWWSNVLSYHGNTKDNRAAEKSVWTAESVLDAATVSLIARMTALSETPDAARQGVLNTAIVADKTAGLWTKYDAFWLMAAHGKDSGLLNIIADEFNLTLVSTPAFTTDRGYTGNGTDAALNCNYTPASDASKYLINACSFGMYVRTNNNTGTHMMSAYDGRAERLIMLAPRESDGYGYFAINNANERTAVADSSGMWIISRTASNAYKIYRNGVEVVAKTGVTSGALLNAVLHLLCYNNNGTLANFSNREASLAFIGGVMTQTDVTNFQTIWVDGYLDTIGAKV